ncbi:HNH endonuclease signature motif containing protein [Actinomadura sp. LOL_016]|uniref:HNH endonuclease signature motif containing protein n=1 Tax=unclassified Actinomadura TaxID=2626254 RepID=UPI003A80ACDD
MSYPTFLTPVERAVRAEREAQDAQSDELPDDDACWEWAGARDSDGYGVKTVDGRQWRVHRLVFMQATGEDPAEHMVLHSCDNPPCYRPSHLRLGTHADNMRDKVERDRCRNQYTDADACVYGHAFTEENTYVNPASGNRQCRTCRRLSNALDKMLVGLPKATRQVMREVHRARLRRQFELGEENHPDLDPHDIAVVTRHEYAFRAERWKEINAQRASSGCEVKGRNPAASCTAWDGVLLEEVYEALAEPDPAKLYAELIQVAAVAQAWAGAIDRRTATARPSTEPKEN